MNLTSLESSLDQAHVLFFKKIQSEKRVILDLTNEGENGEESNEAKSLQVLKGVNLGKEIVFNMEEVKFDKGNEECMKKVLEGTEEETVVEQWGCEIKRKHLMALYPHESNNVQSLWLSDEVFF